MAAWSPAWDVGTDMPACPSKIASPPNRRVLTIYSRRHTSRGASLHTSRTKTVIGKG